MRFFLFLSLVLSLCAMFIWLNAGFVARCYCYSGIPNGKKTAISKTMLFQFQFQLSEGLSVLRCDTKERMCVTDSQNSNLSHWWNHSRYLRLRWLLHSWYLSITCVCVCAPCALCRVNAIQLKNTNIDHRGDYDILAESTIIALII